MTEVIIGLISVLIGLIGVLIGAGIAHYTQMRATKLAMEGERQRILAEAALHDKQVKLDKIRECVADILIATEPVINSHVDASRLLVNVHKVQMLLDTDHNEAHRQLNEAINKLAFAFTSEGASQLNTYKLQDQMVAAVKRMNN